MGSIHDAMAAAGLAPAKAIELNPDGKIHRYRITGDKAGSLNGWVVFHGEFGSFGSWKTGETHTWHPARSQPLTPAEQAAMTERIKATRAAQAQLQSTIHAEARTRAQKLWSTAHPATNANPYLKRKQAQACGIRQLRDMLLIPARDVHGTLHTLQFISADGTKRFLTGGRISGCYCAIGKPVDSLLIAEGYVTAATLFEATGRATAACFSCGNMLAVARSLREKFPSLKLVLCADNDIHTPGNPGLTKAREAARAVGGFLAVPAFEAEAQPCPF